MIGQAVSHYRILEVLGAGGMGVVYKAEDTKLQRSVALKFLPAHTLVNDQEKQRFLREARAAAALNHPNIATVYEIDEDSGTTFLAMEFVAGQTLKDRIRSGPLELTEAVGIARQITRGLNEAHTKGIVHRDIKPANIMITATGGVKILDFGLAKSADQTALTKTGATPGTVAYMSPEQALGEEVDSRTDLWSLGIILYEMVCGRHPFTGGHEQVVIHSILNDEPVLNADSKTDLPPELIAIVDKALAKDRRKRYQRAEELLDDLERIAPGSDSSDSLPRRTRGRRGHGRRWLAGIGIALAIALAGITIVRWLAPHLRRAGQASAPLPIAVIDFANQTGDAAYDYLMQAIPNLLITSLERSRHLRVTTQERLQDLLGQMGQGEIEVIDRDLGFTLCHTDGIDIIVLGSFTRAGDVFATDVKIFEVASKRLLVSASVHGQGAASILQTQIDELSHRIASEVGLAGDSIAKVQEKIVDVTTGSLDAYSRFLEGRRDFERYYHEDALEHLEQAVVIDTTFATAYHYLAMSHELLGNIAARDRAFRQAERLASRASEKERLYIQASHARWVEKDLSGELRTLERLVTRFPQEKRAHFLLARAYRRNRDPEAAVEHYLEALELNPEYTGALNSLAYTYADQEKYEKAFEYLGRYVSLAPDDANVYDSLADLHFRVGNLDEVISNYEQAIASMPAFASPYGKIAYVHALREEYAKTAQCLERFVAAVLRPGTKEHGRRWRGFYEYWQGRHERAVETIRGSSLISNAVQNLPGKTVGNSMLAWICYVRGEITRGREYADRWLAAEFEGGAHLLPETVRSFDSFYDGLADLEEGQLESARNALARMDSLASSVEPTLSGEVEFCRQLLRAELALAEGSPELATGSFEELEGWGLRRLWDGVMVILNFPRKDVVARALLQLGEVDAAIAEYERLVDPDPNRRWRLLIDPRDHCRLARLYEEKGLTTQARQQYEKLLAVWSEADADLPELIEAREWLNRAGE